MAVLPPIFEDMPPLRYDWFPTKWQCFIYRNWDMVTPVTMARVLGTDAATVTAAAADLGLAESTANEELWRTRGYVTLIRANWHLLDFSGLCTLLAWDEGYLAYILKEDDFLEVKLGGKKPDVLPLTVTPLTEGEQKKTAAIRRVTEELRARIPAPSVAPFDFSAVYPKDLSPVSGESRMEGNYICAYEALYGDIFNDHSLIEKSLPEDMLAAYAALGIEGIVCQAVLSSLIPCKYAPALSEGWEHRLQGLNKVIARLGKYGLKVYLYINEPREFPDAVFEKHPHLRGDVRQEGYASLCLSVPEAQEYLRESIRTLTALAPGIGAYSICTASENHTNCYSHKADGMTTCPRCASLRRSDLFSLVVRLVAEGAHAVDPSIRIIAATWGWDQLGGSTLEVIDKLPKAAAVWAVSEHKAQRTYENVTVSVADYSIAIPGPAEHALTLWDRARRAGVRVAAKIQLGNSWELSAVPFIPVYGHFYAAIRSLCEGASPEIVQLTWTMGSFPSPVFRMFAEMTRKDMPIPALEDILPSLYPNADRERLLAAIARLDEAFDEFPFSVHSMYNGPQHMGPALPLWREPTGWRSCMVGPIYDDMTVAANAYDGPYGVFLRQYERLVTKWAEGLAMLREAFIGRRLTDDDRMLLDCAEVAYLHFASSKNHLLFIRDRAERMNDDLLREEETMAIREAEIMGTNPTIGFEATNHYFFTRTDLFEKVLNCRYLRGEL